MVPRPAGPRLPSRDLLWLIPALVLGILIIRSRLLVFAPTDDDALLGADAMRVAEGAIPYRDYFLTRPPASDFLYAAWFRLLGASYLSLRLLTAVALLGTQAMAFAIGRRIVPAGWAAVASVVWVGWSALHVFIGPYHYFAALMALTMTWSILRGRTSPHPARWFGGAGVLAGVAVLFLQSMAPVALAGLVAAYLALPDPRRSVLPMAGAGIGVAMVFAAWLAAMGILGSYYEQTVSFVTSSYIPTHTYSFPWSPTHLFQFPGDADLYGGAVPFRILQSLFWLVAYVVPVLLFLLPVWAVAGWRRRRLRREVAVVVAVSCGLFIPVLVFLWEAHAWANACLALLMLTGASYSVCVRMGRAWRRAGLSVAAVAATAMIAVPLAFGSLEARTAGPRVSVEAGGTTVIVDPIHAETIRRVVEFARAHPEEEAAFIPLIQGFYPLTGQVPPVSQVVLVPGYNTPDQVRQVQDELLGRPVRWLFYVPFPEDLLRAALPGAAVRAPRGPDFDAFIARRYEPRMTVGPVLYLGELTLFELRESP